MSTPTPVLAPPVLTDAEQKEIASLNGRFHAVYHGKTHRATRGEVMRQYVSLKQMIAERGVRFGLVNNRIYLGSDDILIPYLLGKALLVYRVHGDSAGSVSTHTVRDGTIITDQFVRRLTGFEGKPIDLESELFELNLARCKSVRIGHVRDMVAQLQRVAQSDNQADAAYLLRTLVAQTSLYSFKEYLSAKNLKSEVRGLYAQLLHFFNSPLSYRLPFLVRILVRNISSVVSKPKLIDRLWNDTIDLAEVHLRGSDIVNEIRRSTHHAVGKRTLLMVQAYLDYLESGSVESLLQLGCPKPGSADEEARQRRRPKEIVARILDDLKELLGSADVLSRIDDWRIKYATTLLRCESDSSMAEEVERVVADGIGERNRWIFYHHIRVIRNRAAQFSLLRNTAGRTAERRLNDLLALRPDESGFDARNAETELKRCVGDFVDVVQSEYQENLFQTLDELTAKFHQRAYFETFIGISELRKRLRIGLSERAFPEQRLLLFELDCLLEEMSYVALRHVASRHEEAEVSLPECLEVIYWCALNLTHDGLYSRQLLDLVRILMDRSHTYGELANVLQQIQRHYQDILRQLTLPFERMQGMLDLNHEELRIALANMQRFLHDLNSMAFFADLVLTYIEHHGEDTHGALDRQGAPGHQGGETDRIIHLSHHDEIHALVGEGEPTRSVRASYGGKGSGLIYISHLNIPTPDGFIIPTAIARRRSHTGDDAWLEDMIRQHLSIVERDIEDSRGAGLRFGGSDQPLLLAVRGGSVFSMPGILSTVLYVGINDEIAETLANTDAWHAYDSYRRFLASYGQAVWGVDVEKYDLVEKAKARHGVKYKDALNWEAMRDVVEETKDVFRSRGLGEALDEALDDPFQQLLTAVRAVLDSWNQPTARRYRELKGICDTWQSAVIVQEMVSGNRQNEEVRIGMDEGSVSLTGVIPRTKVTDSGFRECTGEFKFSACGEDLVGGLTTSVSFLSFDQLTSYLPMLNRRINHIATTLRRFMGTDQEIEFTVDRGILSVLQSRASETGANRTSNAFRDPGREITRGLGIRGSAFRGLVAFDEKDFKEMKAIDLTDRDDVDGILMVLENPTPADIPLVLLADGLLATKGGTTSHAAVAISSVEHKDYSAVMSARRLRVNASQHEAVIMNDEGDVRARIHKGDVVSIHGSTGKVYVGTRPIEGTGDGRDQARG